MSKTLAVKYRPKRFVDVVEQENIKKILMSQIKTNTIKNAYLFCGGAGTGKTTCARIFANEINNGEGNPIEMDAASNNSVDNVRDIIKQAQTQSLNSKYKIFILDECHALSNSAWQAMLKLIEEPPVKSIFIFCTTDPQKIPKTIISRVQRYDFQRISQKGIVDRLQYILDNEHLTSYHIDALEYIAKIANGGMRDAITLLDKCLALDHSLTIDSVVKVIGVTDYDKLFELLSTIRESKYKILIETVNKVYYSGVDIQRFIKQFTEFILDICVYSVTRSFDYINIPKLKTYQDILSDMQYYDFNTCFDLLPELLKVQAESRYSTDSKSLLIATLLIFLDKKEQENA